MVEVIYSRAVTCCGYLTSNQNVLIYPAHIKKLIARLYFFYSEKQNN